MRDMVQKGRYNAEAKRRNAFTMLSKRQVKGERNSQAVLSESDARLIKSIKKSYGLGAKLARHFGISETVVSGILKGKRWTHIKPTENDRQRALAFLAMLPEE